MNHQFDEDAFGRKLSMLPVGPPIYFGVHVLEPSSWKAQHDPLGMTGILGMMVPRLEASPPKPKDTNLKAGEGILQGTNDHISHLTGCSETHRLKSTKTGRGYVKFVEGILFYGDIIIRSLLRFPACRIGRSSCLRKDSGPGHVETCVENPWGRAVEKW